VFIQAFVHFSALFCDNNLISISTISSVTHGRVAAVNFYHGGGQVITQLEPFLREIYYVSDEQCENNRVFSS
jgi:hypothetical protein